MTPTKSQKIKSHGAAWINGTAARQHAQQQTVNWSYQHQKIMPTRVALCEVLRKINYYVKGGGGSPQVGVWDPRSKKMAIQRQATLLLRKFSC